MKREKIDAFLIGAITMFAVGMIVESFTGSSEIGWMSQLIFWFAATIAFGGLCMKDDQERDNFRKK